MKKWHQYFTISSTSIIVFFIVITAFLLVLFEYYQLKGATTLLAVLLVVAVICFILFSWLYQQHALKKLAIEKKLLSERFEMLSKYANDAIILYSDDLTILQVNDQALELYGYRREELVGLSVNIIDGALSSAGVHMEPDLLLKEGTRRYETMHKRRDGTHFPAEVSIRHFEIMGSGCFQSIVRDITQRKQYEKALIESEERLKLITNTIPQVVFTARPNGRIDFVNSRFESLTGIRPFCNDVLADAIHPDDYEKVRTFWREAVKQIKEHQIRFRMRLRGGIYRWFLGMAIPLCDENLNVVKWFGSATDIDELENMVAQRTADLSDLYNNAPCGYFTLSKDCVFLKINDTALKWLGYLRSEVIDRKTFYDMVTPESGEAFKRNMNALKSLGVADNLQYEMLRKNGSVLIVLLNATAVKDKLGNIVMIRTTIIDHTERQRYEDEILKLNSILQSHASELEETNKELEAFIYSVSHDLRAPLRAILGFSGILLDEQGSNLNENGKKMLDTVHTNAHLMGQLIEDLLRLSRVNRHELACSRIDMNALFNSLIDETKQNLPSMNSSVTVEPLAAAYGDLALIKLMVGNLLSNAIKFSGKQREVEIHIGCLAGKNESIYYIKDNGIGFDMKDASELFNVFHRLRNSSDYDGTGIGLALAKRILDKHEGRIWAESEPGKGAVFYFALPERIVN